MHRCVKCKSKFSYKELMTLFWNLNYDDLECKSCNSKYKLSIVSRIIFGILLVALPLLCIQLLDVSGIMTMVGYLIYALLLFIATPPFIIYRLTNKKEQS